LTDISDIVTKSRKQQVHDIHPQPHQTALPEKPSISRYDEIGNRLKAYRLGANLSADDIAARLGISRTALYRFERGELAKIETLERLADLLGVSVATLLGVGVEYIPSAISYFERMRQIEETSDHIIVLSGPVSSRFASDEFVETLEQVLTESVTDDVSDRKRVLGDIPKVMKIVRERRELYRRRRPAIVKIISAKEVERFLRQGLMGGDDLPDRVVQQRRELVRREVRQLVQMLESPPVGIQIGILRDTMPHVGFQLFRQPDRKVLALSPFRLGGEPNIRVGVAMLTSAPDALAFHETSVDEMWGRALKGQVAADLVRRLLEDEKNATGARGKWRTHIADRKGTRHG
jgi:transcriptional regulator with XRE-family HTH domain